MIERLQEGRSLVIAGHRGFSSAYPENTLLSFQKALEIGVDMLEFDLRLSKDKEIVVIHDETVDRTTNGTGRVSDLTLGELKRLDAGIRFGHVFEGLQIPTLEELCQLLAAADPDVLLNVEIKPSPEAIETADRAIEMLNRHGMLARCVFTSFDARVVAYIHDVHRLKTQGFPKESMHHFIPGEGGTYSKMWAAALSMKQLTPEAVRRLKEEGLLVWCYCPDDEEQVRHALECGITVMTCNNPVPALEFRRQWNADRQ
jgi:glycerophosphoryl diester phosphodiesterase